MYFFRYYSAHNPHLCGALLCVDREKLHMPPCLCHIRCDYLVKSTKFRKNVYDTINVSCFQTTYYSYPISTREEFSHILGL